PRSGRLHGDRRLYGGNPCDRPRISAAGSHDVWHCSGCGVLNSSWPYHGAPPWTLSRARNTCVLASRRFNHGGMGRLDWGAVGSSWYSVLLAGRLRIQYASPHVLSRRLSHCCSCSALGRRDAWELWPCFTGDPHGPSRSSSPWH